jgi:four helix bundle protein
MAAIQTFRELVMWKASMELVAMVGTITRSLPKHERYALAIQMMRAVTSIPMNIAEGYGRGGTRELAQFLRIARGSTNELETQLECCLSLSYGDPQDIHDAIRKCIAVRVMLIRFIQKRTAPKHHKDS